MSSQVQIDLTILRGTDFSSSFVISDKDGPIDMTGWTVKSEIRDRRNQNSNLIKAFNVNTDNLAVGKIILELSDSEISTITQSSGWYDVLYTTDTGIDYRYFYGEVKLLGTVTKK